MACYHSIEKLFRAEEATAWGSVLPLAIFVLKEEGCESVYSSQIGVFDIPISHIDCRYIDTF